MLQKGLIRPFLDLSHVGYVQVREQQRQIQANKDARDSRFYPKSSNVLNQI